MSIPKICANIHRNTVCAVLSGTLFFVGWWLMIDVNVNYNDVINKMKVYYIPGLMSSLAFVIINLIPDNLIKESYDYNDKCHPFYGLILLFFGFIIAFGSLVGACYIIIADFLIKPHNAQWPGYGIFLQNALIFVANMVAKFCIKHEIF